MLMLEKIKYYLYLMRFNKPIGIFLLLWPTLWALVLASNGLPQINILIIFVTGVIVMRAAGCIINDIADRRYDKHVERTKQRPLVSGKVSVKEGAILLVFLFLAAFILVLFLNRLCLVLAFVGAALTLIYPFLKRFTHLPQIGLGLAFSWGVPMAFAAVTNNLAFSVWWLFFSAAIWPVIYDTMYAMTDKKDDIKVGVKSTAILFAHADKKILAILQVLFIGALLWVGYLFQLKWYYFLSLMIASGFFCYQQVLIKERDPKLCFQAFLNNNWVGLSILVGLLASYYL
jgi:4-hydroxybenzoate polyprenyltransferase